MKKNMGTLDKTLRVLLGIAIILFGANNNSVWGVMGIIPIIATQVGVCPLYTLLGVNTCPSESFGAKK